jgi:hypothetical protein
MTEDDDIAFAPYELPPADNHPATIAARLMELPDHAHLAEYEVRFEYLLKVDALTKGGKMVLGAVHEPMVQGKLRDLFLQLLHGFFGYIPDFLIIIDREFWQSATPVQREALIYHELCHVKQQVDKFGELRFDRDGNAVMGICEHDVAAFNAEVARYGAWSDDLVAFREALQ